MDSVNRYYTDVLKNHYFDFDGRATRKQFWMFVLINFILAFLIGFVARLFLGDQSVVMSNLYSLAMILPALGISVRRLHDVGKSGWWILIGLIPIVGWIILIVFYASETKK